MLWFQLKWMIFSRKAHKQLIFCLPLLGTRQKVQLEPDSECHAASITWGRGHGTGVGARASNHSGQYTSCNIVPMALGENLS